MISTETLIALVHRQPALWDPENEGYRDKKVTTPIWEDIAEKLHIQAHEAKVRWQNARDTFCKLMKSSLKRAKETGSTILPFPRWPYFRSMLFLKDLLNLKDELAESIQFIDAFNYIHQPTIEDAINAQVGSGVENGSFSNENCHINSVVEANPVSTSSSKKRVKDSSEEDKLHQTANKRHHRDNESYSETYSESYSDSCESFVPKPINEEDEDYYFLMSILPSVRRIRKERKTNFKMRVLQLIMEEEKSSSTLKELRGKPSSSLLQECTLKPVFVRWIITAF